MSKDKKNNYFKPINFIDFKDVEKQGDCPNIPESDLTIQAGDKLVQYGFVLNKKEIKKQEIESGVFTLNQTQVGLVTTAIELKQLPRLKTITNTKTILDESEKFFSRLHVYEQLGRPKKRAVMLHSIPGLGKTQAINEVCEQLSKEEGTCVLFWDTGAIRASSVLKFFSTETIFKKDVKRIVLVIEDIGGVSVDGYQGSQKAVDSSMLALLDGNIESFTIPIFILATTNSPEIHASAMLRPGRFDKVIKLNPPNKKEVDALIKFIAKIDQDVELDEDGKKAVEIAYKNEFSIAHLQEIVIRSLLDDIPMSEVAKQLADFKKAHQNSFVEMGAGIGLRV